MKTAELDAKIAHLIGMRNSLQRLLETCSRPRVRRDCPLLRAMKAAAASPGGQPAPDVTIEILHVPDCPRVDRVRALLDVSLNRMGLTAEIREVEGSYPSPTVRIGGMDVTGRNPEMAASCRIDLPTEDQIVAALRRVTGGTLTSR